jgi:O-antigen/teichoic acid export membrane protein
MKNIREAHPLFKEGGWAILDQIVVSGTRLGIAIFLARFFSTDAFGMYYLCFSTIIMVQSTVQNSLVILPAYSLAGKKKNIDQSSFFRSVAWTHLFIVILIPTVAITCELIARHAFSFPSHLMLIGSCGGAFASLVTLEFSRRILFFYQRAYEVFLIDLIRLFLQCAVFWGLYFGYLNSYGIYGNPSGALFCIALATFPTGFIGYSYIRSELGYWPRGESPRVRREDLRDIWIQGRWWCAASGVAATENAMFPYVLAGMHRLDYVAMLGVCNTIQRLFGALIQALANVLTPATVRILSDSGVKELQRVSIFFLRTIFILGSVITLVFFLFGKHILPAIFGGQYLEAVDLAALILAVSVLRNARLPAVTILGALCRPQDVFRANLVTMLLTGIAVLPTIWRFGVYGVPITMAFTYLINWAIVHRISLQALAQEEQSPVVPS